MPDDGTPNAGEPQYDPVTLSRGFSKVSGSSYETETETRIRIEKQKRMHKFQTGYEDVRRPRRLFEGSEQEARFVYEVLKEMFDDA